MLLNDFGGVHASTTLTRLPAEYWGMYLGLYTHYGHSALNG